MKLINTKLLIKAFEKIFLIRRIEQRISKEFKKKKIFSFLHLYIGQEASATGVALEIKKNDIFFGNHRSHGHYLAKGGDLNSMIAEIYGKITGCSKGMGGSMHLIDTSVGFMGSTAIVGNTIPVAVGLAWSLKLKESQSIACVYFGDGATEEGAR